MKAFGGGLEWHEKIRGRSVLTFSSQRLLYNEALLEVTQLNKHFLSINKRNTGIANIYWSSVFPPKSFILLTLYLHFKCNSSVFKAMSRMKTFYSCTLCSVLETMLHNILLNLLLFFWNSLCPILYIFCIHMGNSVKLLSPIVFCQIPQGSSNSITFKQEVHSGQKSIRRKVYFCHSKMHPIFSYTTVKSMKTVQAL